MKSINLLSQGYKLLAVLTVIVLLTACDSAENTGGVVALNIGPGSSTLAKTTNDSLILSEVKILLRDIKLEKEDGEDFESDSSKGENDQDEYVKAGPFVVHLNLNGITTDFVVSNIPAGVYDEIKFKLHQIEGSEIPPDPEFKDGDERYSVIVKGSYNSIPFVYKSKKSANQELEFEPPISIIENTATSLTITVNPNTWFYKNNLLLDPSDPSNESEINNNIEKSFQEAFEDNDDDGEED